MTSGRSADREGPRTAALLIASLALVSLVAVAVARGFNGLFCGIVLSAIVATAVTRRLFPGGSFFSLTFANLIAAYAATFAFFVEELFGHIRPPIAGIGFGVPVAAFLVGCWMRRSEIRAVVDHPDLRDEESFYTATAWLVPVFLVGAAMFALSMFTESLVNTEFAFLLAMFVIGMIVIGVSRSVAVFLVDAGLLFEEFFFRMSRLAVPAFAFLIFYSLLVIVFASAYSILSQFSTGEHFRIGNVARVISFSEAIHFSIVTISTVGYGDIVPASNIARILASLEVICGIMLLLFGVSELLEYTREHRRDRPKRSTDTR